MALKPGPKLLHMVNALKGSGAQRNIGHMAKLTWLADVQHELLRSWIARWSIFPLSGW